MCASHAAHLRREITMKTIKNIAEFIAAERGVTKKEAELIVNQVFAFIEASVNEGESVRVAGFGTFKEKFRPARKGRNPATGEPMNIAESRTISLKAIKSRAKYGE